MFPLPNLNPILPDSSHEEATEEDAMKCYMHRQRRDHSESTLQLVLRTFLGNNNPFNNENIQRHYEHFRIRNISKKQAAVWIISIVLFTYYCIDLFFFYERNLWFMRVVISLRLSFCILALYNLYKVSYGGVSHDADQKDFYSYVNSVTNISNFIVISFALANGASYVWLSSRGSCLVFNSNTGLYEVDDGDLYLYDCNPSFETGGTPLTPMLSLIVGNIFIVLVLRCHSSWAARISYFVACMAAIAAAFVSPDASQSFTVILVAFMSVFIYDGIENESLRVFEALLDLETSKRVQMREMKHFIGNVAHDLKTPLHGLAMCIDHLMLDARDQLVDSSETENMIQTMELCKANCSFMTTAINRTVDFAKVASNVALCAKMETTSLKKAMQWAVKCLTTQSHIPIKILPLPVEMCDFIITDKHWLMENMLCYLSNAVKYSSVGEITISVSFYMDNNDGCIEVMPSKEAAGLLKKKKVGQTNSEVHLSSVIYATDDGVQMTEPDTFSTLTENNNCSPTQPLLCISVEDEGIGIDEDKKSSLFQAFKQTMRLVGGTGLGLYSLAKRVEVLQGKYGVSNRSDGQPGSRFWFTIPYLPDELYALNYESFNCSGSTAGGLSPKNLSANATSQDVLLDDLQSFRELDRNSSCRKVMREDQNKTRINKEKNDTDETDSTFHALVVEDSVVILKATKRMLSKAGYVVDVAENGAIGLEKMKNKVYSIVVMDLQMPVMDGLEATRRIRVFENEDSYLKSRKRKQLIFGVSANGADDVKEDALASGMNSFVPKPFSIDYLIEFQAAHRRMDV